MASRAFRFVKQSLPKNCARRVFSSEKTPNNVQVTASGTLPTTHKLNIVDTAENDKWPAYRILNPTGELVEGVPEPAIDAATANHYYKMMCKIQAFDDVFYNAQRQGRVSFYMQNIGEEAIQVGSASALDPNDMVFAQYREMGVLMYRGFSFQQLADQNFSNESDTGKGRQMPVHYGSKELNYQTVSSPLTTQLPQAVGAAYAMKLEGKKNIAMCYFGEGAASEGDFHAAMNFSATLEAPIIFFCRNNGFAISTPVKDQFRGDGIISRAAGYGMYAVRVDGNDLFAVHQAVKAARELALEKNRPVIIEAMTYRGGHHSTSDDSTRYRDVSEIEYWQQNFDPLARFRTYMESKGWFDAEKDAEQLVEIRKGVMTALETAENKAKPSIAEMFEDIFESKTEDLKKQELELAAHIAKYPDHYNSLH